MRIKTSAPGKLMLFGEHAVVYNRPCIVTAVSSRIQVAIEQTPGRFKIDAPQVKDVRFVEETIRVFKNKFKTGNGLSIKTQSDFSYQYGFGSSSAVTVATILAMSKLYHLNLSLKNIFSLGYQVALNIQGVGSGFDIAAATYGGTIYFLTGGKKIEPVPVKNINLVIGYSGVKADTPKIVKSLKLKVSPKGRSSYGRKNQKSKYVKIFNQITEIVEDAKKKLVNKNWQRVGKLMNYNHQLLQKLEVSTEKLDKMCQAAVGAGAYGAKLSGAGGGDCMISLVSKDKRNLLEQAIEKAGGQIINVDNNAEGVKTEN
ncbi:mevalonate kinase [Candidatus Roizmanbacteria bacterium CG02_land_8_20_14_3_00_36_15]|uniref:Mevalonate kinase n=1 Tax=Candidatus Roizmanbacteria bacterium CG10_big_fil_rev_8_21_14_0_10_36_26 TaxID=1974851 RepID=A0A2M8KLG5_9BACT|nr:MAG: mevalonate kinase [Candidatus Roizmanbacteria bacterium CG03_land_8_20_14_0_80_36_21]PIV37701.1 MAG: mevalonate kinase [Candidatus Roizmanbacteria bacterium CG02_land_8_20_14_3_00_36_15]PIY69658.1 MAG: mevalonate kinase [Candidatus Roizmanbacteria bacterium CG_4_10_14_0_8_um_filter_36_36]PJA53531.1 MAG: mevalonate kinase [Candidatus Roizmanbacteria bacterium CG_4_9_14_3_um_filter_36_11]PJE60769.1 MAG: mevalonate kinase [Candidatus Roizmanbacteria bacterium CG10_big_fil_rev_8_21_14_0_10_